MKKPRFTEQQIAQALRQAEQGTTAAEVCRKLGVSEATFYAWKKWYAGMGVAERRRVRQLEDENRRLKQVVADLTHVPLHDPLSWSACLTLLTLGTKLPVPCRIVITSTPCETSR